MSSGPGRSYNSRATSLPTLMRSFTKMTAKDSREYLTTRKQK